MGSKPNIYLIGLSGTGKTRSGRRLAEILKWPFVEMDGIIEDLSLIHISEPTRPY